MSDIKKYEMCQFDTLVQLCEKLKESFLKMQKSKKYNKDEMQGFFYCMDLVDVITTAASKKTGYDPNKN